MLKVHNFSSFYLFALLKRALSQWDEREFFEKKYEAKLEKCLRVIFKQKATAKALNEKNSMKAKKNVIVLKHREAQNWNRKKKLLNI